MRALAIIAVIAYHASGLRLGGLGAAGVTIFFVLSGFLITRLLLDEQAATGRIRLRSFYARRALRLLPAVVVMVAIVTALRWGTDERAMLDGLRALSYVGDWWTVFSDGMGPLGPTWSLAVEEQFYLVWPPLLIGALLLGGVRWAAAVVGVLLAAGVLFNVLWPFEGNARYLFAHLAAFQAASLLIGVALAFVPRLPRLRFAPLMIVLAATVVIIVSSQRPGEAWHRYADFAFAGAGAVLILVGLQGGLLALQPLPYLGLVSYSWYLWHSPVTYFLVSGRFVEPWPLPLAAAVSLPVAMASYHLVERPLLRWRARWRSVPQDRQVDDRLRRECVVDHPVPLGRC